MVLYIVYNFKTEKNMKEITEGIRARLAREITLIGEEKVNRLINSSVTVIGLGGVGGYVCEMLARAGVGRLELIDFDTVSESNLNRQIIALTDTVGRKKCDVLCERVKSINPECEVTAHDLFVTRDNADAIVCECDTNIYVDAIDNVTAKIALIESARLRGKYIFSSMGTGNKLNGAEYKIGDISKTSVCGLARAVRRELKKRDIKDLDVLYSTEEVIQIGERTPASICYMPATAGLMIAEHIIKKIIANGETHNLK